MQHPNTGRLAQFGRDESGAIAILAAICLPLLVGFIAYWVETAYWYHEKQQIQVAADVAAYSAAVRIRAGDMTGYKAAAVNVAGKSGADASQLPASMTVVWSSADAKVTVRIRETHSRYFPIPAPDGMGSIKLQPVVIAGSASVRLVGDPNSIACILATSPQAASAINVSGSASLSMKGCDIASNSANMASATTSGSSSIEVGCLRAVGGIALSGASTQEAGCPMPFSAPNRDPYAGVPMPDPSKLSCANHVFKPGAEETLGGTYNQTLGTNVRCFSAAGNGIDIKGKVHLEPGLYVFDSDLRFTAGTNGEPAQLTGSGVTLFFADGKKMTLNGNAIVNLSAPTAAGPYQGVAILGSRTGAMTDQLISGSSGSTIQGAVYMPNSNVTYTGSSTTQDRLADSSTTNDGCTQIISATVAFSGSSQLASNCEAAGTKPLYSYEAIVLTD